MTKLADALALAQRGYHLVPVTIRRRADGKKIPEFHRGWSSAPTTDPDMIRAWTVDHPGCSFAIACGPSGIDVVDLDPKDGGPDTWAALGMPWSAHHVLTPSGGAHLYWRQHPDGSIGTSAGGFGRGVDTRGDRGVVFAPGAVVLGQDGEPEPVGYTGELPPVAELGIVPEQVRATVGRGRVARERAGATTGHHLEWISGQVADQRARVRAFDPRRETGFRELLMGAALVAGRAAGAGGWSADALADALAEDAAAVWGAADDDDREWIRRGMEEGPMLESWVVKQPPGSNPLPALSSSVAVPALGNTPSGALVAQRGNEPALAPVLELVQPVPEPQTAHSTAVELELRRMRARTEAARLFAAEQRTPDPGPSGTDLADLLAEPEQLTPWRVRDLWPAGGKVLLAAPAKAGKTTTVMNLVRALVDAGHGARFLDKPVVELPPPGADPEWLVAAAGFEVAPLAPGHRVTLLDFEMTRGQLRRWLAAMHIRNARGLTVETMRGRAWDIRDPHTRDQWADWLADRSTDVLIVDPIGPVLAGLGLDENSNADVAGFLGALDALCREAGVSEYLVVHHAGHGGEEGYERPRGASAFEGWPDALWALGRDKMTGTRGIHARGRDVDLRDTVLAYDQATRRLWLGNGGRAQARTNGDAELVAAIVAEECEARGQDQPGPGVRELRQSLMDGQGWGKERADKAVTAARNAGAVHAHPGANRALHHRPGASCEGCPVAPD